jgi:hypothetical protein
MLAAITSAVTSTPKKSLSLIAGPPDLRMICLSRVIAPSVMSSADVSLARSTSIGEQLQGAAAVGPATCRHRMLMPLRRQ